jgi:hypothetical protein
MVTSNASDQRQIDIDSSRLSRPRTTSGKTKVSGTKSARRSPVRAVPDKDLPESGTRNLSEPPASLRLAVTMYVGQARPAKSCHRLQRHAKGRKSRDSVRVCPRRTIALTPSRMRRSKWCACSERIFGRWEQNGKFHQPTCRERVPALDNWHGMECPVKCRKADDSCCGCRGGIFCARCHSRRQVSRSEGGSGRWIQQTNRSRPEDGVRPSG